ncbi:MAG: hypothetical protein WDO24_24825 [Pseudomonadota bacterium]
MAERHPDPWRRRLQRDPQQAVLRGTARAFGRETLKLIEQNMTRIATGVASGFGATATVDFRTIFAPLVNDATEAAFIADTAGRAGRRDQRQPRRQSRDGLRGFLLHAREEAGPPISRSATATARVPARCITPATTSTTPSWPLGASLFARLAEKSWSALAG